MSNSSSPVLQSQQQPPFQSTHYEITWSKFGIFKPKIYSSVLCTETKEPSMASETLLSEKLENSHAAEFDALMRNDTWQLVLASDQNENIGK